MIYVGLDYHQDSIRVCALNADGRVLVNRDCANDPVAVWDLVAQFGYPEACVLEACCGTADFAEKLHELSGWQVRLAHAGYVRKLKRGPDKSDHDDAYLLADLQRVKCVPEVWLAPSNVRQLRRLVRYRQQLKRTRREIKQQIRGLLSEERLLDAPANPWTKAWLEWLRTTDSLLPESRWVIDRQLARLEELIAEIASVDERIEAATADDTVTAKLLEQPGVGLITAATLRAEIGSFQRFATGKQLARFCAVTPCNASSGKRQADAGIVKACNRELRTILIETAHRLARWDDRWRTLLERLKRTKPTTVAIVAVANRWLRWLYHQMIPQPGLELGG
jgi:transposase